MQTYIGVKMLKAKPMYLGEYNKYRGWTIPEDEDPQRQGYLVEYPDGYQSWSPKEAFENAYMLMGNDDSKISSGMVRNFMGNLIASKIDEKTVLTKCETRTGFVQYEVSSCVDPINFNMEIGKDICRERIQDTIWKCLGFVLQWGRFGLKKC